MSLKNVVKVMNFHSLLRVDRSRKAARKYSQMEEMVLEMLDNILNKTIAALIRFYNHYRAVAFGSDNRRINYRTKRRGIN